MPADHQEPTRILVTGVGGAPGFDLARSLMKLGCEVIGADSHPLASGLLLPLTPLVMPPAADPGYDAELLALCRELRPDALLSTVEQELPRLLALRGCLDERGVTTWLPPSSAIGACGDKALFDAVLREHRIPTPATFLPHQLGDAPDGIPLVVKPRRGQGSKDVYFCATRRQATILCELVPDPIVQVKIAGWEFTADCLVDRAGRASVILRYRLLVKNGLSMVAVTFHDAEVTGRVQETLAAVGAVGPCCVQGFLTDDPTERVLVTEMNARVAGGFPLAEAAGADLVGQALNGLFGRPVDHARLAYQPGVYLTKYVETLAVGDHPGPEPSIDIAGSALTAPRSVTGDLPHGSV